MENSRERGSIFILPKNKKKTVRWICTALVCVFVICGFLFFVNGRSSQDLYVGESVEAIKFLDCSGEKLSFKDIDSDRIVIFYIDKKCSPCVNEIPSINLLCKSLEKSDFKPMVLWRGDYPDEFAKENNERFFYRIAGRELSSFTPCFFVFEEGKVAFKTDKLGKLLEKLLHSGDKELFRKSVLVNISEEFALEDKEYYLAFCDDETDVSSIEDIYGDKSLIAVSNYSEEAMIYDPENVLAELFDITEYPTVVSVSKEYEVLFKEH